MGPRSQVRAAPRPCRPSLPQSRAQGSRTSVLPLGPQRIRDARLDAPGRPSLLGARQALDRHEPHRRGGPVLREAAREPGAEAGGAPADLPPRLPQRHPPALPRQGRRLAPDPARPRPPSQRDDVRALAGAVRAQGSRARVPAAHHERHRADVGALGGGGVRRAALGGARQAEPLLPPESPRRTPGSSAEKRPLHRRRRGHAHHHHHLQSTSGRA
mmetsp:Transcript_25027/g.59623  ORF Transcript_25027/g.59623 Transcript_25027/m.59623 type:complete len:215 (+) Transcript_25027:204-848(+)